MTRSAGGGAGLAVAPTSLVGKSKGEEIGHGGWSQFDDGKATQPREGYSVPHFWCMVRDVSESMFHGKVFELWKRLKYHYQLVGRDHGAEVIEPEGS